MRTFIAFEISDQTRAGLRSAQQAMGRLSGVRWVRPESIHLTLKFIGEAADGALPGIFDAMRRAVAGVAPFEFEVRGLGWFPPGRSPRVLWAGVEPDGGGLAEIAGRLEAGLAECGIPPETRAFKPHVTLGRVRGALDAEAVRGAFERVAGESFGSGIADELVLFMSELAPQGARYTRLGAVGLETSG